MEINKKGNKGSVEQGTRAIIASMYIVTDHQAVRTEGGNSSM